jgi:hypothetical protein
MAPKFPYKLPFDDQVCFCFAVLSFALVHNSDLMGKNRGSPIYARSLTKLIVFNMGKAKIRQKRLLK